MTYGKPADRFEYIRDAARKQQEEQRARVTGYVPKPPTHESNRCLREINPPDHRFFDVDERLNQLFREELHKPWTRTVGVYHPSSLYPSRCRRELYHDRIGTQPRPSHRTYMQAIFDEGHGTHDVLQQRFRAGHVGFRSECRVEIPDLHIAGNTDGTFDVEDWLLEIKTMGDASYSALVRPKEEHVWQVHVYMYGLDIPRTQLLYVNRNNGRRRNFRILFSVDIWNQVLALVGELEGMVTRQEEPPMINDEYTCGSCKFQHHCFAPPADEGAG